MIDSDKKLLLFPVETLARELDFRLVLGALCAHEDNQIFIGNHTDIYELGKQLKHRQKPHQRIPFAPNTML